MTNEPRFASITPASAASAVSHRRLSWGAVFAGAAIALVANLLLVLLGTAIGLAAIDPANPGAFGMGAAIWWALSSLTSLFVGAWVAARLSGVPNRMDGMLQGLVVWSAATIMSVFLLTSAVGAIAGGAMNVLGGAASAAGEAAPEVAPVLRDAVGSIGGGQGASMGEVLNEMEGALTGPNAEQSRRELRDIFATAQSGELQSPQLRQRVVNFMVQRGEMDQARAEGLADRAIAGYTQLQARLGQMKEQALDTAEDVADTTAKAAFWAFMALLLGAIAAAMGGRMGAPDVSLTTPRSAVGSA